MAELMGTGSLPTDAVGRFLYTVSRAVALAGGVVLTVMAILTAVSVVGRALFSAPIPGDFELIEVGLSVAIFALLPYCQIIRGNVFVDFFMERAPVRVKAFLDAVGNLMFVVIAALLLWRHTLGAIEMYHGGETTMIISVPRWWSFPAAVACLALLLVVCVYSLWRSIRETRTGQFE